MSQESVRKENHALRTITAVMMMFIALAHYYSQYTIGDFKILGWHLMSMGRFVIPVFVLLSGYFCFSKDGHAEASIKKKTIHILILIAIFKGFYLIFSTILCIGGIVTPDYVLNEFLIVSPKFTFDCYGGTVDIMTTQPIWFVYSLFLIYGLFFLLYKYKVPHHLLCPHCSGARFCKAFTVAPEHPSQSAYSGACHIPYTLCHVACVREYLQRFIQALLRGAD